MRHRKNNVGLNRTAAHRKALLANLTTALVTHKKIITTLPKARAARRYAERLITFARKGDVAARREVLAKLHSRDTVKLLFEEIGPKFRDRNGGYTRIIKLDNRHGDGAEMAILELVGFAADETKKKRKPAAKKTAKPKQGEEQAAEVEEGAEEKAEAKPKKAAAKKAAPKKAAAKKEEAPAEEAAPAEESAEAAAPEAAEEAAEEPKAEDAADASAEETKE